MNKKNLCLLIAFLVALCSCAKEENNYYYQDEFDLKASQMEQVGGLFDAIARQPEAADVLIGSAELGYADYTALLPISDRAIVQRGKARGAAFSMLLLSISRQPEAFNVLDSAAAMYLGPYNATDISDELLKITRTYTVSALNESLARQPEADSLFNLVTQKYLNYEFLHR